MSDRLSLGSSTSLASSHVATLQSGRCHVARRHATTDNHCSMPTLAGILRSHQPPEVVRRGENFVVESAIFEIADLHFSVHFETLEGCNSTDKSRHPKSTIIAHFSSNQCRHTMRLLSAYLLLSLILKLFLT